MISDLLTYLGASDSALTVMGPSLTILLSFLFGGGAAQMVKFPLGTKLSGPWYDWTVRAIAVICTAAFAHFLSDTLPWAAEIGVGAAQPVAYKVCWAIVDRKWPWLETNKIIGSANPSSEAVLARARRLADDISE